MKATNIGKNKTNKQKQFLCKDRVLGVPVAERNSMWEGIWRNVLNKDEKTQMPSGVSQVIQRLKAAPFCIALR